MGCLTIGTGGRERGWVRLARMVFICCDEVGTALWTEALDGPGSVTLGPGAGDWALAGKRPPSRGSRAAETAAMLRSEGGCMVFMGVPFGKGFWRQAIDSVLQSKYRACCVTFT